MDENENVEPTVEESAPAEEVTEEAAEVTPEESAPVEPEEVAGVPSTEEDGAVAPEDTPSEPAQVGVPEVPLGKA